jgi:succinoglycan biosynthesis protein ExoM
VSRTPSSIAVCICTYARPDGIRRVLEAMVEAVPASHAFGGIPVRVVIVDNDAAGPSRDFVRELSEVAPWPIDYVVEPRRGIPQARNAAVAAARTHGAWVAFLDDDETPLPGWLDELLAVQAAADADVVAGPVLPVFDEPPPAWILNGRFFDRPRHSTGQPVLFAATNNVLVAPWVLDLAEPTFDESLALSGGEDTILFRSARLAGMLMVWADEAVVLEHVPRSRVRLPWLLRREYRRGSSFSVALVRTDPTAARRMRRVAHSGVAAAQGCLLLLSAARRGRPAVVAGLQRLSFAAGTLTGLSGWVPREYGRIHGS